MADTQLTRSMTSTGNRTTATFSAWVKKSNPTKDTQALINFGGTNSIYLHNAGFRWNDGTGNYIYSNALQRDPSGWYHLLVAIDTTQSVDTNRVKMYVNGGELTLSATSYPDEDEDLPMNVSGTDIFIGNDDSGTGYLDGVMSYVYWIDGLAYAPTVFGETDATTGEWKIITSPTVTMGTNGFLILKNGATITDQSSNSNDFTLDSGTLTATEDCPDDVFATWNPLANQTVAGGTFTTGNNTWQSGNSYYSYMPSTIGVAKGKFYWEVKVSAKSGASEWHLLGISSAQPSDLNDYLGELQYDYSYYGNDGYKYTNASGTAFGDTYAVGDIVSVALDIDNLKVYFAKNGTWQDSGDPTSGATGTGAAYTIEDPANTLQGCYFPSACYYDDTTNGTYQANFGNGYFGSTIISSEGTNASGIGKFEYDVPTGYTALSTKGMNS